MLNNHSTSIINDYWQIETLKMINWGVYDGGNPPHTVEFARRDEGSLTMVTGNSGTGKSTILDALITGRLTQFICLQFLWQRNSV